MFANSTILKYHNLPTSKQAALDIRDNIYFVLPYLSQRSVVLSQLPLAYLYYLELSLTVFTKLQNYSLCESLINSFEVPSEKTTTTK